MLGGGQETEFLGSGLVFGGLHTVEDISLLGPVVHLAGLLRVVQAVESNRAAGEVPQEGAQVFPVVGVHPGLDVDVETAALDGPGLHGLGGRGAQQTEATAIYACSGYRPVERYKDNPYAQSWMAKDLE